MMLKEVAGINRRTKCQIICLKQDQTDKRNGDAKLHTTFARKTRTALFYTDQ